MNNSMNKINDPGTKNDIKQIVKGMSKALVDNSNSLLKSHEIVNRAKDPMKKQKLQKVHNELQDTTESFRNRFARILGDMKYLVDDPKDRMQIEKISNDLQNKENLRNIDDKKLASDIEDLGNTCLNVPVRLGREPPTVNKIIKNPSNSSFDTSQNKLNPVIHRQLRTDPNRTSMLTPGRIISNASRSPIRANLHNGKPLLVDNKRVIRKPTGTTAYTNKFSPIASPSSMGLTRRMEPSKSTNNLTPSSRVIPVQRGLTPSRSYNNLTPARAAYLPPAAPSQLQPQPLPQNYRGQVPTTQTQVIRNNPAPRYSLINQTPGKVIPTAPTTMRSPTPTKRYRRLENGELVEIGPNDAPHFQAASPITRPSNVFKNPNSLTKYPRASSPNLRTSSYRGGTPIKSSNRITAPANYNNQNQNQNNRDSFNNSRRFVLPQSPSFEPMKSKYDVVRPLEKKDINLTPLAPPEQKYNKKRERLRSLSKNKSQNAMSRIQPSTDPVRTTFNDNRAVTPLPVENLNAHSTNPGNVRNTPIYDEKFASQFKNGEYVIISILYFLGYS